ncbi:hypothetical protein [Mucilaginibacter sp. SG564]|uniref:hypothetical protein n=1 Tax=unclassified Mucilaginibacter TaxID=2617802 RepID=UPI001555D0CB|nr:hypothetical protein [Mucilaginibacter sp. SG564]NOW96284.1 hypothetical protein [Mucilaginibacter sp. SG564]
MKNLFKITLLAACVFMISPAFSQTKTKKDTSFFKKVGDKTGKVATSVGHKTAEIASKGAAAVADKKYADKVGPRGQTIYIDKNSKYFYVNKKGKHIYISKSKLKDKPVEKK